MNAKNSAFYVTLTLLLGGCTSLPAELESISYPPDMAILITNVPYMVNSVKCAEIRSIGAERELHCYDAEGNKSAVITPVSEFRRNITKEKLGFEWASAEHQAFLFDFIHNGGADRAVGQMTGTMMKAYSTAKGIHDLHEKQNEISEQEAEMKLKGTSAYLSGGMSAWQKHQFDVVQWRLDNSRFFSNQLSTNPLQLK